MQFFKRWQETRREAAAEKARVERLFDSFVEETRPLTPRARKHREAAVYRHAWKRAVVLELLHQRESDETKASLYRQFQKLAADVYFGVAPKTRYGTVPLKIERSAGQRLLEAEEQRLSPRPTKKKPSRTPCIYVGRAGGRAYVGQTVEAPERRWLQHRADGTGPFKSDNHYVNWEVIEGDVKSAKLDERESYTSACTMHSRTDSTTLVETTGRPMNAAVRRGYQAT